MRIQSSDNGIYQFSNETETVNYSRFSKTEMKALLGAGESVCERVDKAQRVITYLCEKYDIPVVKVQVLDANRPVFRNGAEKHGDYTPAMRRIRVWNRTAKRGNVIAIKTFIDTLLHEFIHHYDIAYLKMGSTPHTTGFYKRIADLKGKLL